VKILIGNAYSRVDGFTVEQLEAMRKALSYEVEGTKFARIKVPHWDGAVKLMSTKGEFPSGLLPILVKFLQEQKFTYEFSDQRDRPKDSINKLKLRYDPKKPPRDYQIKARDLSSKHNRGVYIMGTGAGKTLTSAMIVEGHSLPTLFVTPDTGLRKQAFEDYSQWFPGQVSIDINSNAMIVIANIQSLANKPPEVFQRFKVLMIDEFHHGAAKTYQKVNRNCSEAFYRYGFTGTYMRPDGKDMEMHGVLSQAIFRISTSELIERGFLVKPYITIYRYEIPHRAIPYRTNYVNAYNFIVQDVGFANLVNEIARTKIEENKQTLILVRRKEHGRILSEMISGSVYLNGDDEEEHREYTKRQFINKKIRCVIATNIFGEGIDIPSIDVLINARAQKTEIQTSQGIGRALRKHEGKEIAEVYDFWIVGQKHLEEHSIDRISTYKKERAFKISVRRPK
jgi:superfamily II DNA or RNA helicase